MSATWYSVEEMHDSDGEKDAYCICKYDLWAGMHASLSVMCTVDTSKIDSTHQCCNVVHTWYILETIIHYDIIKLVVFVLYNMHKL